ncbi:MAG: hypothetical protein GX058_08665 [Firmicutes bacterium]|nr:hypothetical protein [Bacillota bacterium]
MTAILVMLSNYFHDLAVGLLFSAMLLTWWVDQANSALSHAHTALVKQVVERMRKVAWAAWAWIIIGGVIRTVNYYEYEWLPAAGRGQVAALVVKHILLAAIAISGAVLQSRISRRYRNRPDHGKEA